MTNTKQPFKATKKAVVADVIQLQKDNVTEVYKFIYGKYPDTPCRKSQDAWETYCNMVARDGMDIKTLEDGPDGRAKHVAIIGDYIIKGGQGECWPVKEDIMPTLYDW